MRNEEKSSTEVKRDHHYVPAFHIKRWTDDDGKVLVYQKDGKGVVRFEKLGSRSILFEKDLYLLREKGEDPVLRSVSPDYVENRLHEIDTNASIVLEKMLLPGFLEDPVVSPTDGENWAVYANSLIERHPRRVANSEKRHAEMFDDFVREFYPSLSNGDSNLKKRLSEAMGGAHYLNNESKVTLLRILDDPMWREELLKYQWQVFNISPDWPFKFLLSDEPVYQRLNESGEIVLLAIPLNPVTMWFACPPGWDVQEVQRALMLVYFQSKFQSRPRYVLSSTALNDDGFVKYTKLLGRYLATPKFQNGSQNVWEPR